MLGGDKVTRKLGTQNVEEADERPKPGPKPKRF